MSLRHDELPPLTPAQQAEALRLAARLQAEANSTDEFLRAAEEAGIEPRFLHEAIRRLPAERQAPNPGPLVLALLAIPALAILGAFFPLVMAVVLISALMAMVPCSNGRSRIYAAQAAFGGWLLFDLLFVAFFVLQGSPLQVGSDGLVALVTLLGAQLLASLAGTELARQAYRLPRRPFRRRLAR